MRSTLLVLSVLVVTTAGCGGSSKKSSAPPTTTTSTMMSTTTTTSGMPMFATSKNCTQLGELGTKMSQAMQAASGKGGAGLTDEAKVFQAMASAAPSEIRDDFKTFASAFTAYAQAMGKAGFKPGTTPTAAQMAEFGKAAKAFSAPELQTASQHLSAWAQKNCTGVR